MKVPVYEVTRGLGTLNCLGTQWDDLVNLNSRSSVFQTSLWYKSWIEVVSAAEAAEPIIIQLPNNAKPRGGIALQVSRRHEQLPVIEMLSAPWADYHDAIGDPCDDELASEALAAVTDFAAHENLSLALDDIVPTGLLARACRNRRVEVSQSTFTSTIDLLDVKHLDGLTNRSEYLLKLRRLRRLGNISYRAYTDVEGILGAMPRFIDLHRRLWEGRSDAVAPFDGGVVDCAFYAMARSLGANGKIVLSELLLDDVPLAAYFGFLHAHRYFAYRTAYERSLRHYSPGHLLVREMLTNFKAEGVVEFDFMRGAYQYKTSYATCHTHNIGLILDPPLESLFDNSFGSGMNS